MNINWEKINLFYFILLVSILFSCKQDIKVDKLKQSQQFADSLIAELPLEVKIGLLHGMGGGNSEFGDLDVQFFGIGGNKKYGIPPLYMGHGITGVRSGRDTSIHATYFCTPIAMGCSWDTSLYSEVGTAIAKEMRALGQDLNLGPTLNIIRHPLGGRNWECFSEDPYLTSQMAIRISKAMQNNGIICGPKHFVANNQENNRFDINNEVDERTLREIYLPAFKAAVTEGGALNIMGAYNRLNGEFMCHNKYLLDDILRGEWGFKGFVLSDFANGVRNTLDPVNARMNIEMHRPKFYGTKMLQAIEDGSIKEEQVDTLLKDVLTVMHTMNIFERERYENPNIVHCDEHIDLCRKVAQETPVLLKNEQSILPLDIDKIQSVAVIGPNAKVFHDIPADDSNYAYYLQGGGSGRTYYFRDALVEPFTGIQNAINLNTKLTYAQGCKTPYYYRNNKEAKYYNTEKQLITEAVAKAKESEIAIIFAGNSGFNETEGWDRKTLELPGQQNRLIKEVAKANPNTIVVLVAGSTINLNSWIDDVKAVLFVPYCGEQIGNGVADLLTGKVSPSGKLPFTWVKSVEDYPEGSIFQGKGFSEEGISNVYSEGIFVGYRWFDKQNIDVRFPFGYGLSYSEFNYSNLNIQQENDQFMVQFDLTNTGEKEASEIAELYISDTESTLEMPIKELKAFDKVSLQPGQTKAITFKLEKEKFAHYNPLIKKWEVEKGDFKISVGSNSRALKLSQTIEVK